MTHYEEPSGLEIAEFYVFEEIEKSLEMSGYKKIYTEHAEKVLKQEWFLKPSKIHGIQHTQRVIYLSLTLAFLNKLGEDDRKILVYASMLHDIGRAHDGCCLEHGYRSFERANDLQILPAWEQEDMTILQFLIENHCIDDAKAWMNLNAIEIKDENRLKRLFEIFKDADGLDRVRIQDLDLQYLRNKHAAKLEMVAHLLLRESN